MNNKDLIKQYVDTGLQLPDEQIKALPPWATKTYMRKRFIAIKEWGTDKLSDTEYTLLTDEQKSLYIKTRENIDIVPFNLTPNNVLVEYIESLFTKEKNAFGEDDYDEKFNFTYGEASFLYIILPKFAPSPQRDLLIKDIINNKNIYDLLNRDAITVLLEKAYHPVEVVNLLKANGDKWEQYFDKLIKVDHKAMNSIDGLIKYSYNPTEIIDVIGEKGRAVVNMQSDIDKLWNIIVAKHPKQLVDFYGNEEIMSKVNRDIVRNMIWNGNNKEELKEILTQYNIPYEEFEKLG